MTSQACNPTILEEKLAKKSPDFPLKTFAAAVHPADPAANQENGSEKGKLMRPRGLMGNVVASKIPEM